MEIISYPQHPRRRYEGLNGVYVHALERLKVAGSKGLPVGKGAMLTGGLATHTAKRYLAAKLVTAEVDEMGKITRVYACQLSFDFFEKD